LRRLELPADLFAEVSEKLVDAWRAWASKDRHDRRHPNS
jgi:hypothetical protein